MLSVVCKVIVHVRRELAQRLVEVVHLGENTSHDHDNEHIRRRMRELVVTRKRHLESQTERLDEHDGDRARRRANGEVDERVLAPIFWRNLVNHEDRKHRHEQAVEEEAYLLVSVANS